MNKKGTLLDLLLTPTFTTFVVLGIVFLTTAAAIVSIGESTTYEKKFHSANIALLIDALQSVPRELNIVVKYDLEEFQARINPHKVTVFEDEEDDGLSFMYTINPDFGVTPKLLSREQLNETGGEFTLARSGSSLWFSASDVPAQDYVICPTSTQHPEKVQLVSSPLSERLVLYGPPSLSLGDFPFEGADIALGFMGAPEGVRVYINENPESYILGCRIVQQFLREQPFLQINVVPVNTEVLRPNDPRMALFFPGPAAIIARAPDVPSPLVERSALGGLKSYGLP